MGAAGAALSGATSGANTTTGLELVVPLSALGWTGGNIEVLADINGGGDGYLSNQFLPGLAVGSGKWVGDLPARRLISARLPMNIFTVVVPEPSTLALFGLSGLMTLLAHPPAQVVCWCIHGLVKAPFQNGAFSLETQRPLSRSNCARRRIEGLLLLQLFQRQVQPVAPVIIRNGGHVDALGRPHRPGANGRPMPSKSCNWKMLHIAGDARCCRTTASTISGAALPAALRPAGPVRG